MHLGSHFVSVICLAGVLVVWKERFSGHLANMLSQVNMEVEMHFFSFYYSVASGYVYR
jgi:TRAP-type mannitol/chloroaromatic compound transport system permease small subunit